MLILIVTTNTTTKTITVAARETKHNNNNNSTLSDIERPGYTIMTKKKRSRNNKTKKVVAVHSQTPNWHPIADNIFDHSAFFENVSSEAFDIFLRSTYNSDKNEFRHLLCTNILTTDKNKTLPFPIVVLCCDRTDQFHLLHGIQNVSLDDSESRWNEKWIGYSGGDFTNNFESVKILTLRGKWTKRKEVFFSGSEEYYTTMDPSEYGKVPMVELMEDSKVTQSVRQTNIHQMLLLKPTWIRYFRDVALNRTNVVEAIFKILEEDLDLTYIQRKVLDAYAKSMIHDSNNKIKLKYEEPDSSIIAWKESHLIQLYGNPTLPLQPFTHKMTRVIENMTKDAVKQHYEELENLHERLYTETIPRKLMIKIEKLFTKHGYIQCFAFEDDLFHYLRYYIRNDNDNTTIVIDVNVHDETITYDSKMSNEDTYNRMCFLYTEEAAPLNMYDFHADAVLNKIEEVD